MEQKVPEGMDNFGGVSLLAAALYNTCDIVPEQICQ